MLTREITRKAELKLLEPLLASGHTQVLYIHGISGIGKTTLLQQLGQTAPILHLDCAHIEPTDAGFLHALSSAIGEPLALDSLAQLTTSPTLIALDNYESLKLLDMWIRQFLTPKLPRQITLLLCSRQPPHDGWLINDNGYGQFKTLELGPLDADQSHQLLQHYGVEQERLIPLLKMAQGHPLALYLAACSQHRLQIPETQNTNLDWALTHLTEAFLSEVDTPKLRKALEASSVTRRLTKPLLRALLEHDDVEAEYDGLQQLDFVGSSSDGLHIHDLVRSLVARSYKASDPEAYRHHQQNCWWWLQKDLDKTASHDLWRHTADLLYLVENPRVREAFFPCGSQIVAVEPALPKDYDNIMAMVNAHDGPQAKAIIQDLWNLCPSGFGVVRQDQKQLQGFACVFEASQVAHTQDPVIQSILSHLKAYPVPQGQTVLITRRWLSRKEGELPSAAQGAFWLDCKRLYMAFKPSMRRIYLVIKQPSAYQEVMQVLGFKEAANTYVEIEAIGYHCMANDMGPGSVDGWLTGLAERELGVEQRFRLLVESRQLLVDDQILDLTPLEFGVAQYLLARPGRTVSRTHLLQQVWLTQYQGGSNVVDAVVRTLRKKLGPNANAIATVTGVGYRLNVDVDYTPGNNINEP
jgi:hypothetical protein